MAVSNTPIFPQVLGAGHVQILNATGTALVTIYTAGSNGSKIVSVLAASTDTSAQAITLGISRSSVFYQLSTYTVAIQAGTTTSTPAQNLLTGIIGLPIDNDGNPYIFLLSGDTLQAQAGVAITSGKAINLSAFGADF